MLPTCVPWFTLLAFVAGCRGCNQVDEVLYQHYERKFEELVLALPPSKLQRAGTMFDDSPEAKASEASPTAY